MGQRAPRTRAVTLLDGTTALAWLETPTGGAHPLINAVVQGFPPGQPAYVSAIVGGLSDLGSQPPPASGRVGVFSPWLCEPPGLT